jgi:purine-cytosine permease-like protein
MIQMMLSLGLGIPAMLIVLLAAWANGASNLYSGSLVLAAVFQRSRRSTVTIGGAILGLGAALSGVTDQVVPYLLLLSIAIPPIAGVYLSRFFIDLRGGGARADPGEWVLSGSRGRPRRSSWAAPAFSDARRWCANICSTRAMIFLSLIRYRWPRSSRAALCATGSATAGSASRPMISTSR